MGFLYQVLILGQIGILTNHGHFTVISSVLCRAENLDRLESRKPSHEAFSQSRTVLSLEPSISRIDDILLKWFS